MNEFETRTLICEARDAALLKQVLREKLKRYGGIKHEELELICAMFGIQREDDEA